jgi:hypothetical protein
MKTKQKPKGHTFAETTGNKPFNWFNFLSKAIEASDNGTRVANRDKAEGLSQDWVMCACGHQCKIIPRDSDNAPKDARLSRLGLDFCDHVTSEEYLKALGTLTLIEHRAGVIIDRILARRKK